MAYRRNNNDWYDDPYQNPEGYPGNTGWYDGEDYDGWEDWDDPNEGYGGEVYQDPYTAPNRGRPTMASRAAGKSNPDPYSRASRSRSARQAHMTAQERQRSRQQYGQGRPRRKKRHGFRNFILFLLILAVLCLLLFRPPVQSEKTGFTRNANIYNILICATDEEGLRTDTIMMLTMDRGSKRLSLTSLPRDTIVDSEVSDHKLNSVYAMAGGGEAGAEALMEQTETLLGFRPDGYMVVGYELFRDVVDAMGGVTFDVPMEMTVDNPGTNYEVIHLYPGEQKLSGDDALAVCRFRSGYAMADIQREYVQQSFLKAMIRQALSPSKWIRLPAVYMAAMQNIFTDLSGANLRYLAVQAMLIGYGDIQQNTLPGEGVDYYGASCYGLFGQSVVDLVNAVMNPFQEEITIDDVHILTVSGGTLVESTWRGTAFDASTYQYN